MRDEVGWGDLGSRIERTHVQGETADHAQTERRPVGGRVDGLGGPLQGQLGREMGTPLGFRERGEPGKQHSFSLELVTERASYREILLHHFAEAVHRSPPGHGWASCRSETRSTLAYMAVVSTWR